MRTIAFFSFKGGVGRTNLVLNAAYALARKNKFVVVADWDIHAPGLTIMAEMARPFALLTGYPEPPPYDVRDGVANYLDSMLNLDGSDGGYPGVLDPKSLARPTRLGEEARERDPDFRGDIWFIPAGPFQPLVPDGEYDVILQSVQQVRLAQWTPEALQERNVPDFELPVVVNIFCDEISKVVHGGAPSGLKQGKESLEGRTPDYLLLDCRTGMTEIGDMILHAAKVDRVVLVSGLNAQNLAGLEMTIRALQEKGRIEIGTMRNRVVVVASPVPTGEEALKTERLRRMETLLDSLAREMPVGNEQEPMPEIYPIPYHPHIALSEALMIRAFPKSDVALAMTRIVDVIQVNPDSLPDEKERRRQFKEELARRDLEDIPLTEEKKEQKNEKIEPEQSKPHFPVHPWAQLPVWYWPEPGVSEKEFVPGLHAEHRYLLNGLARSVSISKEDKSKILENIANLSDPNILELATIFREETSRYNAFEEQNWPGLLAMGVEHWNSWLEVWCTRRSVSRQEILEKVLAGERDQVLGGWSKIGYFWFVLAGYFNKDQKLGMAEQAYRKAIALDEKNADFWNNLGNFSEKRLFSFPKAEEAYRKAIALDKKYASPWKSLGNLYSGLLCHHDDAKEAYHAAAEAYRAAIALDEKDVGSWNNLGNLLWRHLGCYPDAEAAYRKAIASDERDAGSWNNLGDLLRHSLRYADAEEAYRKAIALDEKFAIPWNGLGVLFADYLGNNAKAEGAFRKAIALDENYAEALNNLGNLLGNCP
ncbi:MAG: tetratricopeptide repeat protein [Magnetococcus sp. DMHC-1]